MLTNDDLKQIGTVVEQIVDERVIPRIGVEVGKVIEENVTPALDRLETRLDGVETRLEGVETRLARVEATMVTKAYLDDKLVDLEGSVIIRQRKEDQKMNRPIDILHDKAVLADSDVASPQEIEVFPSSPRI